MSPFPFTPLTFLVLVLQQLALYVLSFLEPKDLLQAAQTCRYWRILAEDNLLWREKCREEGECFLQQMQTDKIPSPSRSGVKLPLCFKNVVVLILKTNFKKEKHDAVRPTCLCLLS